MFVFDYRAKIKNLKKKKKNVLEHSKGTNILNPHLNWSVDPEVEPGHKPRALTTCTASKTMALLISYSEIRDEIKFMHVCMLPSAGRVRALCNLRLECLPYDK